MREVIFLDSAIVSKVVDAPIITFRITVLLRTGHVGFFVFCRPGNKEMAGLSHIIGCAQETALSYFTVV